MTKVSRSTKTRPYDDEGTRVIAVRVESGTLRDLRLIAVHEDRTVSAILRETAEKIVAAK